jgi:hypothetical protein
MRKAPEAELMAPKRPGSTDQRQPKFIVCGRPTGNCSVNVSAATKVLPVLAKAISACLLFGRIFQKRPRSPESIITMSAGLNERLEPTQWPLLSRENVTGGPTVANRSQTG